MHHQRLRHLRLHRLVIVRGEPQGTPRGPGAAASGPFCFGLEGCCGAFRQGLVVWPVVRDDSCGSWSPRRDLGRVFEKGFQHACTISEGSEDGCEQRRRACGQFQRIVEHAAYSEKRSGWIGNCLGEPSHSQEREIGQRGQESRVHCPEVGDKVPAPATHRFAEDYEDALHEIDRVPSSKEAEIKRASGQSCSHRDLHHEATGIRRTRLPRTDQLSGTMLDINI